MISKAEEHFPNLEKNDAIQKEANLGPGREAVQGEGGPAVGGLTGGIVQSVKEKVADVVGTMKEANPATRDMREKHC